jgi:hypothetical protein
MRTTNRAGNVRYANECELCKLLEEQFFPSFFDAGWMPLVGLTKEVMISKHDRVDYQGVKDGMHTFVEVKNWFVRKKEVAQVASYKSVLKDEALFLICGGIEPSRRLALESMGVEVLLTKDLNLPGAGDLTAWM